MRMQSKLSVFDVVVYGILAVVGILTLFPFWYVTVLSLNDAMDSMRGGVYLWPREFSLESLQAVSRIEALPIAFFNSITRTLAGVAASLVCTSMLAYALSRKEFVFRVPIQRLFVITMYISGGIIPVYFVYKYLGLRNNYLVYILPMLLNAYYLLIIRSFMDKLPQSIFESARMDGANEFTIFSKIAAPLSAPVLGAIALYVAVDQWNSWYDTFVYTSIANLTTLQMELVKILTMSTAAVTNIEAARANLMSGSPHTTTPDSIRMAITVVATIPILLVYPFVQRYFVKGITVGAVKE